MSQDDVRTEHSLTKIVPAASDLRSQRMDRAEAGAGHAAPSLPDPASMTRRESSEEGPVVSSIEARQLRGGSP